MSAATVNAYFPALSQGAESGDASSTEQPVKAPVKAQAETPSLRTILRSSRVRAWVPPLLIESLRKA